MSLLRALSKRVVAKIHTPLKASMSRRSFGKAMPSNEPFMVFPGD
jgi:hypothetical protein